MEQFQNDLLASVRQMKTGKAARVTSVEVSAGEAGSGLALTQKRGVNTVLRCTVKNGKKRFNFSQQDQSTADLVLSGDLQNDCFKCSADV